MRDALDSGPSSYAAQVHEGIKPTTGSRAPDNTRLCDANTRLLLFEGVAPTQPLILTSLPEFPRPGAKWSSSCFTREG
jgi:hypothetical protein